MKKEQTIQIHYNNHVRNVMIIEADDPINLIYHCEIDGLAPIDIAIDDYGKWKKIVDYRHFSDPLAELIGRRMDELEKLETNDQTFLLSVEYKGKKYDLTVTPQDVEGMKSWRIVHSGRYLMKILPPDQSHQHYWASYSDEGADQLLAATIGEAIERY